MRETAKRDERELVAAVVDVARKGGAEMAEAYFARGEELVVEVRQGEVETLKIAREEGIGVRVIRAGRLGFAFTSNLNWPAVKKTINDALANVRTASEDPYHSLPDPPAAYPDLNLEDPTLRDIPLAEKIEKAREIERAGHAFDSRIKLTERATYEEAHYQVTIANSRGLLASYRGSFCGGYAVLVAAANGEQETGFGLQFTRKFKELDPGKIGREAASKAISLLGARRLETKRVPVVFDPYVVTNFLGIIASALTAEAVQKGRSLFAGKVGKTVAAKGVTVVDDATLPGGLLSAPFDGEGVPAQHTVLIKEGQLQGFLHNTYTAAKDGVASTGNAARGSYKSPPELGSTNFYLTPGESAPEEIIKGTSQGLYLAEVMGMHTANPISGDFSVGAAGIWIEHGELTKPVRGMVIAGNILELLETVDAVGNDLRFFIGKGAPTIRVTGLTVSGK
ncbi:MAG: TldD/PmbA family protein [Bacillota bacterium]|nr:TldD/PmbA family protein [Bacillota bacterium]